MLQNQIHISPLPAWRKLINRTINRLTRRRAVHLFLLASPLSGSTMMLKLIGTSPSVASFDVEGQRLPELIPILNDEDRWNPAKPINWAQIRRVYESYWSPLRPVRFEKSPPLLVRAVDVQKHFPNSHFIVLVRNPYAQIEGVLTRGWKSDPIAAALSWVKHSRIQLQNLEQLDNVRLIHYEKLTEKVEAVTAEIQAFVSQLGQLDLQTEIHAHNVTGAPIRGVRNLNEEKIDRLTPKQVRQINMILQRHSNLMERFGYPLISADAHAARQREKKRDAARLEAAEQLRLKERELAKRLADRAELKRQRKESAETRNQKRKAAEEKRDQALTLRAAGRQKNAEAKQKRQQAIAKREQVREQREANRNRLQEIIERRQRQKQETIQRREAFIADREKKRAERLEKLAQRKTEAIARRGTRPPA